MDDWEVWEPDDRIPRSVFDFPFDKLLSRGSGWGGSPTIFDSRASLLRFSFYSALGIVYNLFRDLMIAISMSKECRE